MALNKKIVVVMMLILLILSMLTFAFNIQPVWASGTIYIRADGSIDPPTAPITTVDNVTYTFTDNIYDSIVIERDSIIVDGQGYTVQGTGGTGITLSGRSNVTIKNMTIKAFYYGIWLGSSSTNSISGNNITANNGVGIYLYQSSYNSLVGNNVSNSGYGIYLHSSSNNGIFGNNATASTIGGMALLASSNYNDLSGNVLATDYYGLWLDVSLYNTLHENYMMHNNIGVWLSGSSNNTLYGNNMKANTNDGIWLSSSSNNTSYRNNITDSPVGIRLSEYSSYNTLYENNITNNEVGVWLEEAADNRIYHNNFMNEIRQVHVPGASFSNFWDDGYPSGGNYWSDYNGTDLYSGPYQNETGNDGMADTPYVIDESNIDNYPLMTQWILNIPSHMVVAYPYEPSTLDPARCYDTASMEPILNVYEPLLFFDEEKTDQFVPRLATSWAISADGLNYTFTIRQGVKFHNGETLTTEDVEYSFERFMVLDVAGGPAWVFYEPLFDVFGSRDAEGGFTVTGQQIDNAITRNETAVTIHLTKPYPPFMQILAQTWSSILCKKWCVEIGDWPGTWNNWTIYNRPSKTAIENQTTEPPGPHLNAMCGTGPFLLDYYRKGVEWSLVKFDSYWGGWPAPGSNGFLQRVTSKRIDNWEVRKNMFLEGQLDHTQVPRIAIDEVLGQPGIRCIYPLEDLTCYAMFFTFNISTSSPYLGVPGGLPIGTFNESGIPPNFFSDINVRKGFAYAFNYSKLIEEELRGEAYQPATPIISGLPFYNPGQEKYSINLDMAADYFASAWGGQVWNNGFNFTICYNEGNLVREKACEIIKANIESINDKFHIQIQPVPWSYYIPSLHNHEIAIFQVGWLADYADPHNFVYAFMYSGGTFPQWQMYSNETIDELMRQGIGTTNETARRQAYYELQRLYHEDCPSVPLYQTISRRFERDWVQGWYYNQMLWWSNYFYVQWKGSMLASTMYSWPMFHHDLSHTGYTESPTPNTNQTQWSFATGGSVCSSPAVADGRVYIGSTDRKVYCLDAATGASKWSFATGGSVCSSPAVADGRVYIGSTDRKVYCLAASTGELFWNYTTGNYVSSSPAVADGKVYVGSYDGKVYCLDAETGASLWNYTAGLEVCSSPAIVGGKVFVGSAGSDYGDVYCLDAATGARIWAYRTFGAVSSSPAVADGKVYVGSGDGTVYCLNAYTGDLIWNYATSDMVSSSPAVADGRVYVGSYNSKVYCLAASTGELFWNYTTGNWTVSSPAVADGRVYVGSYDGKVYCLDAATGASIWNYITGGCVESSPAVTDGLVYVGSYDQKMYAFGNIVRVPEDYKTVQEAINASTSGSTIVIAPGIYHESIVINKTLTIIGLPGSSPIFSGGGSGIAITLLPGASGSIIAGIVITHWDQGILVVDATNCKIYDNIMSLMNSNGITLEGNNAANNLIYSNIFQDNTIAINLTASSTNNTIYKNIISLNNIGFNLESGGNVIYANTISENQLGIDISNSNGNIIYHNNFINNNESAKSEQYFNAWDNGYSSGGNYWSDYTGVDDKSGINQNVFGSDGIGDTNYTIAVNNIDRYPLLQPFNPHDIGITNVITSKTIVGQGFTLRIDLKILNYGIYDETFAVTAYVNTITIATQTVILISRNSTTITFTWNTSGFAKGNYTISAYAWPIPGETDTADNRLVDGVVTVALVGDVNADGIVDIADIYSIALSYGTTIGTPQYKPNLDINDDGIIDIADIYTAALHYGETSP
jgi:peptide/nickel transport system substrate-binding protein